MGTVHVGLDIVGVPGQDYDISCFGLDAANQLSDDRYLVFYNQRQSPEGALAAQGARNGDRETFLVDLARLPASIAKLVFTVTTDGTAPMSQLQRGHIRLLASDAEVGRFAFSGSDFAAEKAVIVGELYRKDVWRFAAVGQGFNGGLSALLAHFGGAEATPAQAPPQPAQAPPPPPPPKLSLSKITLDKKGDKQTVDLRKGGGTQPLHFNLNWDQGGARKGLFGKSTAPDLDLGCFWQLNDGSAGVIQPLGGNFGRRNAAPFIELDKDDRSGAAADGENLFILRPDLVRRVLVFALIYEGATDFTSVGARLVMKDQAGNEITVFLNNPDRGRTFCVICTVTQEGGKMAIIKQEQYFQGHSQADKAFGWGFRWSAGRK